MTKAGERLIAGMREAVEIMEGRADPATYRVHRTVTVDVRAIRNKMDLSQSEFAVRFGFPLDTLRKWEQGTRQPTGAAKTLLIVIDKSPETVVSALEAA
ncbi:MAG: helix-turn-helix protein [Rhodospirillales bacterium]|jgi:putative transcriptional regulator|nr:helix-turn-helix protein [Rhodospirillales bacterium]